MRPRTFEPATGRLIPQNLDRPGDDPIFALNAEAIARAQAGEDILNSTLGTLMNDELRLAVMPSVCETYRRIAPEEAAAYAPIAGRAGFLAAVVADALGTSSLASSAVAVATPGGTGALYQAVVNFLEPGQALLTTSYFWGPYQTIALHAGRSIETFPMFTPHGEFHCLALERALERQVAAQGRVLLFLNTPCHNPTGYSLDEREWERIVALLVRAAGAAPLTVLVDVAYARFGGLEPARWLARLAALLGRATLLVAWSASKAFAQYGSRVGACVAIEADPPERERIRSALAYSCRGTWSNCNHLGMLAIERCLTDPALRERIEREREALRALLCERVVRFTELAREQRLAHPRYEGGFFVAVFTPDAERTAAVMRERGVYVVPLPGAVRVAICATPCAAIPRLVEALAAGVRAAGG